LVAAIAAELPLPTVATTEWSPLGSEGTSARNLKLPAESVAGAGVGMAETLPMVNAVIVVYAGKPVPPIVTVSPDCAVLADKVMDGFMEA
jgi:hypothetical protein